ncbi:recombinase family protein [Haloplasma contractile]|uniref:Site-specific recombinase DNA invertase Pin protein n=1 Tax=Haloplasma contractile SSD-17B TaxID=1033810 RepID=U2FIQ9_9MOLU|nr:recombinase family protein [Haloplasma contractile]ERJ12740.1 Site-specific recombinase DNA invertase Pin protein [Haloplasma contractile SSD-17B]
MRDLLTLSVSTAQQVEHGQSLDVQKNQLIARAISDGYNETDIFIYKDPGISGSKFANRPEILKLIDDIQSEENVIEKVYSFKLDRISRSTHEIHWFINLCSECGVSYVSLKDGIDTSNVTLGKILVTVFGLVSELELENIRIRTTESRLKRYKEGKSLGGKYVSLGYKRLKNEKGETYFVINEEESKIIHYIFNSYVSGMSKKNIAINLNRKNYKTRTGRSFLMSSVERILKNPIYIGKIRYNNSERNKRRNKDEPILVDGLHEPIISREVWDKVQARLNKYKLITDRNFEDYLFSSKIVCFNCGARMYGRRTVQVNMKNKKRHKYYTCFNNNKVNKCDVPSLRVDLADNMFMTGLKSVIKSSKFKLFIKRAFIKETFKKKNEASDIANLEEELESLKKRKNNLIEQYANGLIDEILYNKGLKIVNDKLDDLNAKSKSLNNADYNIDQATEQLYDNDINVFVERLLEILSDESVNHKQKLEVINDLVNSIRIKDIRTGQFEFELSIKKNLYIKVIGSQREEKYNMKLDFDLIYTS